MKKDITKCIVCSAIVFICAMILTISVYGEEYKCDVSSAVMTQSSWGQSYTEYTPLETDRKFQNNFNPLWMTKDSEVIVEYDLDAPEGELKESPVELIWQTWDGPREPVPEAKKWAKIAPYEYDRNYAVFSYDAIVESYGTDDFSTVYAINIGDTGTNIKVTSLIITNIDRSLTPAPETPAPVTVSTPAQPAEKQSGTGGIVIIIIIAAAAVTGITAAVIISGRKRKKSD